MKKLNFRFLLLGVIYAQEALNADEAREKVLVKSCNGMKMPLDTEMGQMIWGVLSTLEPYEVHPVKETFHAEVMFL